MLIDKGNIPTGKKEREAYLQSRLDTLVELPTYIVENNLSVLEVLREIYEAIKETGELINE